MLQPCTSSSLPLSSAKPSAIHFKDWLAEFPTQFNFTSMGQGTHRLARAHQHIHELVSQASGLDR